MVRWAPRSRGRSASSSRTSSPPYSPSGRSASRCFAAMSSKRQQWWPARPASRPRSGWRPSAGAQVGSPSPSPLWRSCPRHRSPIRGYARPPVTCPGLSARQVNQGRFGVSLRDLVKSAAPAAVRDGIKDLLVRYGERTSDRRALPDFLIIGTKRGGTTSLWRYLLQHPLVPRLFPAWNTKTSHYFEENWSRGEAWYRSHFPTDRQRAWLQRRRGAPPRVGEAAPLYMFHPLVAERVAKLMPHVKLIVLLRDPVERAYSHWKERRTEGTEPLSFAEALEAEEERTAGEREKLIADPYYHSNAYDWYTYRARGRYLEHLEPWLEL